MIAWPKACKAKKDLRAAQRTIDEKEKSSLEQEVKEIAFATLPSLIVPQGAITSPCIRVFPGGMR